MPFRGRLLVLLLLLSPCLLDAAPGIPILAARSAILMEAHTGTILYEYRADLQIPPASLTKLMTLHIALEEIAAGRLDPEREIVPDKEAWASSMEPRSSVMHLGANQKLTVSELLRGMVVVSGNDAAVQVALLVSGSVPEFARRMNDEARELGLESMHFVEPSGISAKNMVTARDYALFCCRFVELHPEALRTLLSVSELTYPLARNVTGGRPQQSFTQTNRNVLLGKYPGIDGLKTGYIDESGYNFAATVERDGMRLISVILGVARKRRIAGDTLRVRDSTALLDYGFDNFTLVRPDWEIPAPVRVWKGSTKSVPLVPAEEPLVVVLKERSGSVKASATRQEGIVAPLEAGYVLGAVVVTDGDKEIRRFPLVAAQSVPRGGVARRLGDSVRLFIRRLAGKKP